MADRSIGVCGLDVGRSAYIPQSQSPCLRADEGGGAITGLALVHRVALRQVTRVTGREIREFRTRAEAMAWLMVP